MSDIPWTADQRLAIETVDRSVAVSAAAGSGKTAALAARCIYLTCDAPRPYRCSIDELLVVTFTEAAAAEMKSRIRDGLRARLVANPHDRSLALQMTLLETAEISTIHAFCLRLIRRWFNKAGIDPAAPVLSAEESRNLKAEVIERVAAELYEAGDDSGAGFRELVDAYGLGRDRDILRFARSVADFLDSIEDPDGWLDRASDRPLHGGDGIAAGEIAALRKELALQQSEADRHVSLANSDNKGVAFYGERIAEFADRLKLWHAAAESLQASPTVNGLDELRRQMREFEPSAKGAPRIPKDASALDKQSRDDAKAVFEGLRDCFKSRVRKRFAMFSSEEAAQGLAAVAPYVSSIVDLVRRFRAAFRDAKQRLEVIDFADQERHAFELLRDDEVAAAVRQRFAHVLVDECQDINPLQAAVIQRVSREDQRDLPANLFTVGDVKQSIYRFRLADPRVFQQRIERSVPGTDRHAAVFLRENFRSTPTILAGVNRLFAQLMRPEVGDIDYDDKHALYPAPSPEHAADPPAIDVHILDRTSIGTGDNEETDEPIFVDPEEASAWSAIERESFVIATEIRRMISGGLTVEDGRSAQPGDIAILLRSLTHNGERVAGFLSRCGIEACCESRQALLESIEIGDVRALLEVLDNTQQDIPLATVLRSRLLGAALSDDDLFSIRRLDRECPFHEAVRRYVAKGSDESLRARLSTVMLRLRRSRRAMRDRPVADEMIEIIERHGYLSYVCGLADGNRRRANLLHFCDLARRFGRFQQQGLHRFLRFLSALEEQDSGVGAAPTTGESDQAVRIMSIHAAKGLEFPIVFVADLGKRFNLTDARGRFVYDRDEGLGLHVVDRERMIEYPSTVHTLAAANIEAATRAEELRILYVAMTRAKQKLVLVGSKSLSSLSLDRPPEDGPQRSVSPLAVATASCPLDWIVPALSTLPAGEVDWNPTAEDPSESTLFCVSAYPGERMQDWRTQFESDRQPTGDQRAAALRQPLPRGEPVSADRSAGMDVRERILFNYPHLALASVPAVTTASEAKGRFDLLRDPESKWRDLSDPPASADSPDRSEAQLRGQATHKVLEHLDFRLARDPDQVRSQLNRLTESGVVSSEEADRVDVDAVAWFVDTPVGQAVRDAGDAYRREFMFIAARPAREFDPTIGPEVDETVLVRGMADGVLVWDDGIEIIDFKTDRIGRDQVTTRSEGYRPQMETYAAALTRIFNRPVKACRLVFLEPRVIASLDLLTPSPNNAPL